MALYEPATGRRQIFSQLSLFTIWLGMTAAGLWMHPDPSGHGTHTQLGLPPCPSVLLFDRPCPGCGLTTSITAFLHGDMAAAFRAHAMGPLLYLGITAWALLGIYGWVNRLRLDGGGKAFDRVVGAFLAIFFVFGFARMFLSPPFASGPEIRYLGQLNSRSQMQSQTEIGLLTIQERHSNEGWRGPSPKGTRPPLTVTQK